jgi:hypothetical protein
MMVTARLAARLPARRCRVGRRGRSPALVSRSYRFTNEWRTTQRSACLALTGGRCAGCGNAGRDGHGKGLHQAHRVPFPFGSDRDTLPLCAGCHRTYDTGGTCPSGLRAPLGATATAAARARAASSSASPSRASIGIHEAGQGPHAGGGRSGGAMDGTNDTTATPAAGRRPDGSTPRLENQSEISSAPFASHAQSRPSSSGFVGGSGGVGAGSPALPPGFAGLFGPIDEVEPAGAARFPHNPARVPSLLWVQPVKEER